MKQTDRQTQPEGVNDICNTASTLILLNTKFSTKSLKQQYS